MGFAQVISGIYKEAICKQQQIKSGDLILCHRESHLKMLTESLLEQVRFDKRPVEPIIDARKNAQLLKKLSVPQF